MRYPILKLLVLFVVLTCSAAHAATFTVSKLADTSDGVCNADCSLREAISSANSTVGDDSIAFAAGVKGVITLSGGQLTLNSNVTITGPSDQPGITVTGSSRLFNVSAGIVNLVNLTADGGFTLTTNGGGILNAGTLSLTNCTVSNNENDTGLGAGIFNSGTLSLSNSTIADNQNSNAIGGGIYNTGTLNLNHCTLSGNSAPTASGGGIFNAGTVHLKNTIVAGNDAPSAPNISGVVNSQGYNLIGDTNGGSGFIASDLVNAAASPLNLSALQDNGGPAFTRAILAGSKAINAGDPAFATPPAFDQRGSAYPRVINGRLDIGAFEFDPSQSGSPSYVVTTVGDHDDGVCGTIDCTLREAISTANVHVGNDSISFAPAITGSIVLNSAQLDISSNVTITGPASAPGLSVDGNGTSRIFNVSAGVVNLVNLTLANGYSVVDGAGGAINNSGTLSLNSCTLSGNHGDNGGAINNSGTLSLTNCTLFGNSTDIGDGGAIDSNGVVNLYHCTLADNHADSGGLGGAINNNGGTVNAKHTLIANNSAPTGPDIAGAVSSQGYNLITNTAGASGLQVSDLHVKSRQVVNGEQVKR